MSRSRGSSLKDQLFNIERVRYLGGLFHAANPRFDAGGFETSVMATMLDLELKARMILVAKVLEDFLPREFDHAAKHIHAALPPPLDPALSDNDFGPFILGSLGEYVANNGLEHPHIALPLLREITKRSSMEFAIRPFLNTAQDQTMQMLADWVSDDHYHVRRLVSEGTRPSLPWGMNVGLDITDPLHFLDHLHSDKTRFVTRSVANHMNDISKKDPALVIETLKKWQAQARQDKDELDWITRHSLRTLIKKGDKAALELLGYRAEPKINVSPVKISPLTFPIGGIASFEITITAKADENLMLDYVIDFVKANGSRRPKVFKWKKLALKKGQSVNLTKAHRFLKESTTFTHYPGAHSMYLQINGNRLGECDFTLT